MKKLVALLLIISLSGCQKSRQAKIAVEAPQNHLNQSITNMLGILIRIELDGDDPSEAFGYINIKMTETLNTQLEASNTPIKRNEWLSYSGSYEEIPVHLTRESISIGEALSEINAKTNTISIIGRSGLIILPKKVKLDITAYQAGPFPHIYLENDGA